MPRPLLLDDRRRAAEIIAWINHEALP